MKRIFINLINKGQLLKDFIVSWVKKKLRTLIILKIINLIKMYKITIAP